tara:strand:+ start:263 stop:913 length:651 start_codon:yes stop_codon:yes gene_type:complete
MNTKDKHQHFKIKIAISGAAETDHCGDEALDLALSLGREIVEQDAMVVTGATTGFPLWVSRGAKEAGGTIIGISPAGSEREHVELYKLPLEYMDLVIYTGSGYSGRDILLTRSSDAVIVGCGRIGTIHEFTVAFEDKKPIGVYEGPWETDEQFKDMLEKSHRQKDNDKIIFEKDPKKLVSELIALSKQDKKEGYGVHAGGSDFYKDCEGPDCKIIL